VGGPLATQAVIGNVMMGYLSQCVIEQRSVKARRRDRAGGMQRGNTPPSARQIDAYSSR
jgi:hypothetical protein